MNISEISTYTANLSAVNKQADKLTDTDKLKNLVKSTDSFSYSDSLSDAGVYSPTTITKTVNEAMSETQAEEVVEDTVEENVEDTEETEETEETTYEYDAETVNRLLSESDEQVQKFTDWLKSLLGEQTDYAEKKFYDKDGNELVPDENGMVDLSNVEGVEEFEFDDEYWGAEATAQRIFDMAKAYAGDNEELLDKMKDAVYEGFSYVEDLFGGEGKLPQVCYDTKDKFDSLFDEYLAEIKAGNTETADDTESAEQSVID